MDILYIVGILTLYAFTLGLSALCARLRSRAMSLWHALALALSLAVAAYLVWALLDAEDF